MSEDDEKAEAMFSRLQITFMAQIEKVTEQHVVDTLREASVWVDRGLLDVNRPIKMATKSRYVSSYLSSPARSCSDTADIGMYIYMCVHMLHSMLHTAVWYQKIEVIKWLLKLKVQRPKNRYLSL
jgi:hypothetical protein